MESNMIKDFNLPPYIKGKSFAEASKAIEAKFKDRTDTTSLETKQELMGRLAKAQEHVKMKEALKANSQEIPDTMNGQIPEGFEEFAPQQGQNQMFAGGRVPVQSVGNVTPNGIQMEDPLNGVVAGDTSGLTAPGAGKSAGAGVSAAGVAGMAGTAMELGQTAFGDTGVDTTGMSGRAQAGSMAGGIGAGAAKGAVAGAALGPWGAAVGGVVGGALGGIGADKAQKEQLTANMNSDAISNNKFTNDFKAGGFSDKYNPFGNLDFNKAPELGMQSQGKMSMGPNGVGPADTQAARINNPTGYNFSVDGIAKDARAKGYAGGEFAPTKEKQNDGSWLGDNYGEILRAAPIASNALQLAGMKKPTREALDKIHTRYKPSPVDEKALENMVQKEGNAASRSLAGATNGSLGALAANIGAVQSRKTAGLSDAMLKGEDMNRQESRAGQMFNAQNERYNAQQSTRESENFARDKGAYNTNKSRMQSALAENIGSFGREQTDTKTIAKMYGYTVKGDYVIGKDGNKLSMSQFQEYIANLGKKKQDKDAS